LLCCWLWSPLMTTAIAGELKPLRMAWSQFLGSNRDNFCWAHVATTTTTTTKEKMKTPSTLQGVWSMRTLAPPLRARAQGRCAVGGEGQSEKCSPGPTHGARCQRRNCYRREQVKTTKKKSKGGHTVVTHTSPDCRFHGILTTNRPDSPCCIGKSGTAMHCSTAVAT
jgi:hypothetical protein